MNKQWALLLVTAFILMVCVGVASARHPGTLAEGFSSDSDPLTTGTEVALWFPASVFLDLSAQSSQGGAPVASARMLYPEEIPVSDTRLLWILESARDPPQSPARFQILHREEPLRVRNVQTGEYLIISSGEMRRFGWSRRPTSTRTRPCGNGPSAGDLNDSSKASRIHLAG